MVARQRNGGIGRGQLTVHLVYHGWDGGGWRPVVAPSLHFTEHARRGVAPALLPPESPPLYKLSSVGRVRVARSGIAAQFTL